MDVFILDVGSVTRNMSENDTFNQTKDAYLCLVNPVRHGEAYRQEIASVIELAPSVPDELVVAMIGGAGVTTGKFPR